MKNKRLGQAVILLVVFSLLFPPISVFAQKDPVPPTDFFQLPWDLGIAWVAIDGIDNGIRRPLTSSHQVTVGGAIDFAPKATMIKGEDTSNYWVAAAGAGNVVGISSCHVIIDHGNGWTTHYYFLANIQVRLGETVARNQRLGIIADGVRNKFCAGSQDPNVPHLHFMLRPSIAGATFAGWTVNYNSSFNITTFSKDGMTVGLFKPLLNVMGSTSPTPTPMGTLPTPTPVGTLPTPTLIGTLPTPTIIGTMPTSTPIGTLPTSTPDGTLSTPTPFGTLPSSTPDGTLPTPTPLGTLPTSTLIGTLPTPTPFGTLPTSTPIGTLPTPTPFGTLPTSTSDGTLPTSTPIGTLPTPTPIGTLPTSTPIGTLPTPTPIETLPTSTLIGTLPTSTPTPFGTLPTSTPIGTLPTSTPIGTLPTPTLVGTLPTPTLIGTLPTSTPIGTLPTSTPIGTLPVSTPTGTTPAPAGPYISTGAEPASIVIGNTALITVSLNNVPLEGYTSIEVTCPYDPSIIEVSNISIAGLFGADPVVAINGPQNGSFIVAIAGSHGNKATTSGTVFTFNAKGLQAGQRTLECTGQVSTGNNQLTSIPSVGTILTVLATAPTPSITPIPTFPTDGWLTFTNQTYGFLFKYPPQSSVVSGGNDNFTRIDLPFVQGTNLTEKYLEMIVVENVNPCQSPLATQSILQTSEVVTINGITFLKQTGEDAGVGHLHQWVAYSTINGNACISLDFILHSLNPGNFSTPPPVFNYAQESAVFEQIVSTFTWLGSMPTATPTAQPNATLTGKVIASKPVTVSLFDANDVLFGTASTNLDGTFTFTAPAGTYTTVASASGFLSAQASVTLTNGAITTLTVAYLPAGDIDGNAVIDQFDALTIGMNYNLAQPSVADLNNDGVINVLDLEALAFNYRKTGPINWE